MSTKFSTACSTCCVWLPVACIPRSKTSTRRDAARRDRAAHRHRRVCDVEVILRSLALAYRVFETPDRIARLTRISVDAQRRLALAADHLLAATEAIAVALTGAGGRGAGWHDAGGQTVAAAVRVIAARLAGIGIRHDAARNLQAADRRSWPPFAVQAVASALVCAAGAGAAGEAGEAVGALLQAASSSAHTQV